MPPKRKAAAAPHIEIRHRVGAGAGMTAGLEIWSTMVDGQHKFVLVDKSTDDRFASDTVTWNVAAGLNGAATKILKDAT
jgi:hypothetical protein